MSKPPDPVDTIERFAELSALLDDPFAEEAEILGASGLDAQSWAQVEARWFARLREGDAADLAARYGKTYRETRERLAGGSPSTVPDTEPDAAGFLNADAQPWRAEAAHVGRDVSPAPLTRPTGCGPDCIAVAETLESPVVLPLPALPFQPPAEASPGATLDVPAFATTRPAVPFTRR